MKTTEKRYGFIDNCWIQAVLFNGVCCLIIMCITDIIYETNDDYLMSMQIVEGYPYIGFVNYFLCNVLIFVQNIFTEVNVFVLFQIIVSFFSFVFITKVILARNTQKWFGIICLIIISVYFVDHYCSIQFTKTSGLALIAGTVLAIDSILQKKYNYIFLAAIMIYIGSCLRFINLFVSMAYLMAFIVVGIWVNRKDINIKEFLRRKNFLLYISMCLLLLGTIGLNWLSNQQNNSTDALKEYNTYNINRAAVIDYPVYENYQQNEKRYTKNGISENDLFLIDRWYLDYDGAASLENLQLILDIDGQELGHSNSIKEAIQSFISATKYRIAILESTGVHILIFMGLAAFGIIFFRWKHSVYILVISVVAILLYIYLYYNGRVVYRATYMIDFGATIWLMYYYALFFSQHRTGLVLKKRTALSTILVIMVLIVFIQIPIYNKYNENYDTLTQSLIGSQLEDYLQENADKLYVCSVEQRPIEKERIDPLAVPIDRKNILAFGGTFTKSPYMLAKFNQHEVNNVFGDTIDNENVFIIDDKESVSRLEEYFSKWYSGNESFIKFELVEKVGETYIWSIKRLSN